MARVLRASYGKIELSEVLDVGGFDLARALERKPAFLEPEYPFEWAGLYELERGAYELVLDAGPDPTMTMVVERCAEVSMAALRENAEPAARRFSDDTAVLSTGARLPLDGSLVRLVLEGPGPHRFSVPVAEGGAWAIYTQHLPEEFKLRLVRDGASVAPAVGHQFVPAHTHEDEVTSVGLELDRPFDLSKLNIWMSALLRERGADLYRMKGIVDIAGEDRRYVFQAVHMLFEGRPDRRWATGTRRSQLVFIGKQLDRASLVRGVESCLA